MQLKEGDRIRCKINNVEVLRAIVQKKDKNLYICQNVEADFFCTNKSGFKYFWRVGKGDDRALKASGVSAIWYLTPNIENIMVGDIIENSYGKRKILGNSGKIWFVSCLSDFDISHTYYTIAELEKMGYKIVLSELPKESQEEIINIDGKDFSKSTIRMALKEYTK